MHSHCFLILSNLFFQLINRQTERMKKKRFSSFRCRFLIHSVFTQWKRKKKLKQKIMVESHKKTTENCNSDRIEYVWNRFVCVRVILNISNMHRCVKCKSINWIYLYIVCFCLSPPFILQWVLFTLSAIKSNGNIDNFSCYSDCFVSKKKKHKFSTSDIFILVFVFLNKPNNDWIGNHRIVGKWAWINRKNLIFIIEWLRSKWLASFV